MGLIDRLLGGNKSVSVTGAAKPAKKPEEAFFLDADASSSMGNVEFMRRSNTIRRTFPGTADSPGNKEMVAEVASMEAKLEKMSEGLAGMTTQQESVDLTGGIPKPVKKTFAEQMSKAELEDRMKGSAVGVNVPIFNRNKNDVARSELATLEERARLDQIKTITNRKQEAGFAELRVQLKQFALRPTP